LAANARRIKTLADRMTDMQDAERIADPLRHVLPKGSFIPSGELRSRRSEPISHKLGDARVSEINRAQKVPKVPTSS